MFFVVLGHASGGLIDAGVVPHPDWFRPMFLSIYVVHMPLFFFLSGLFVLGRVERDSTKFVRGMGVSIVWPYFLWGAIQLILGALAAKYTNTPSTGLAHDLLSMPIAPPAQFWFLYALLALHLLSWVVLPRVGAIGLLIVAFVLASLFEQGLIPNLLGQACKMAPYYALGVLLGSTRPFMTWLSSARVVLVSSLLFLGALAVALVVARVTHGLGPRLYGLESASIAREAWGFRSFFAAILATVAICAVFATNEKRLPGWLKFIGQHSLSIYVLHIMCIAGARIVLRSLFGLEDPTLLLPSIVVIGLVVPLIAYIVADRLKIARYVALS